MKLEGIEKNGVSVSTARRSGFCRDLLCIVQLLTSVPLLPRRTSSSHRREQQIEGGDGGGGATWATVGWHLGQRVAYPTGWLVMNVSRPDETRYGGDYFRMIAV
jgi:hypothetical protein